jgi:hypothetical protein
MGFGSAYLFNKKAEDMRRVGVLGGRARARNLRLRKARQVPAGREISRPRKETTAEAIRCIDALFPWLHGVERREVRRQWQDR